MEKSWEIYDGGIPCVQVEYGYFPRIREEIVHFLEVCLGLPGRGVDQGHTPVFLHSSGMAVAGYEDIRYPVDNQVILMLRSNGGSAPVYGDKMSFLEHFYHDLDCLAVIKGW